MLSRRLPSRVPRRSFICPHAARRKRSERATVRLFEPDLEIRPVNYRIERLWPPNVEQVLLAS
jgi:hypothetical protein